MMTTTEARAGLSVRSRITATVALLSLLALSTAGAVIYALESARLDEAATAQADQELAEFRQLQRQGKDPNTARPFASAEDLLLVFLQRNVPGPDEALIAWLDDRPRYQAQGGHGSLQDEPEFAPAVRSLLEGGGDLVIATSRGEVLLTVQPVQQEGAPPAALVIATWTDEARAGLLDLMRTYAVVALLAWLLITGIATWQAGRLLAPIRRLSATALTISDSDISQRIPTTGNDDITAMTRTINAMLDRLEAAFTMQRQFLDDAGHELKTPLTVLRGHLELLDPSDPDDLHATRELLLDEIDRMARLVGDLIVLAKARRPDFLTPHPVDLADLTQALLAKARALGEREWLLDAVGHAQLHVDEQRITQAVLQLADNAVKHTSDGDVVAIGSTTTAAGTALWVRDTGPGVPAADREQVLERFGRSAVAVGDEGFGLGLSIVRAIAEAHGGSVRIDDAADHAAPPGAMLVLSLPPARAVPSHDKEA